ncbi:MAG TPA: ribulose-phosphate 3-epimerase [Terriglobia bacterium]|nr:ribulose-phosphate 3-epimerase [Terriglobia bacterium]
MALIAPSILAADFTRLGKAIQEAKSLGASIIHINVVDGHFRTGISVGQPVVRSIRQATDLQLDVHLMVERPERYLADFARAGANRVALHAESTPDVYGAARLAKDQGVKVGLALNPGTRLESGFPLLKELDYLLIMSASASSGNQEFIHDSVGKVQTACQEREKHGLHFEIEVEGGIGPEQAEELAFAGADILVVGSALFGKNDRRAAMRELVSRANPDFSTRRQGTQPQAQ